MGEYKINKGICAFFVIPWGNLSAFLNDLDIFWWILWGLCGPRDAKVYK